MLFLKKVVNYLHLLKMAVVLLSDVFTTLRRDSFLQGMISHLKNWDRFRLKVTKGVANSLKTKITHFKILLKTG